MSSTVIIDDFRLSAGGVLTDEQEKKVCLIKDVASNEYLLPKGGKESSETLVEAARREVFEETGFENKISERLLGIHFRAHVGGRPGEHKVIYWYYSEITNRIWQAGTQQEYEDFCNEWLSLEEAVEKLSFDDEKVLVKRAFRSPIDSKELETELNWCGLEKKCIRYLTTPSTKVVRGFAVMDVAEKRILLSLDCVSQSWNLPTEKDAKLSEILGNKLKDECAPFLFQLTGDASGMTVREWYLLEVAEGCVEDSLLFDENEAVEKLKNNLYEVRIVKSAFSKVDEV